MCLDIDGLLDKISEDRMIRNFWNQCDQATEEFDLQSNTVSGRKEFRGILSEFMGHYRKKINYMFFTSTDPADEAEEILGRVYGDKMIALRCACSGEQAGMRGCLNAINEYAKNQRVERAYDHYLDTVEIEDRWRLVKEYRNKYGYLLPGELADACDGVLILNFKKLMIHHATVVAPRLRRETEK